MLGLVILQTAIAADNYPTRPIRFLVPGATGSSQDLLSRIVANKLSQQLNQQVVVDVRAGASGVIGRDFAPLTRMATVANVMTVNAGLGVESVADLVKLAKSKPGQLNYGSAGNGSPAHLAGAMFDVLADIKTSHVPYKGAAQALTDVIGGQLQYLITSPLVAMPHAKGGRIRVLATTGAKRDPLIPELPTVADTVPGYEITQWWGVVVPARTPPAIAKKLHAEIIRALQAPEVRDLIAKQGASVQPESPAEFATFMLAERARISSLGKKANIRLDD
ncbi:MAG: tripartite tricarboxylate transporter substrate binding protein [Betaproteobacteria bacterium]|nr:tripartite tricarboxylate transporter substrate binding protein [Betaproteobacteria bacterium]